MTAYVQLFYGLLAFVAVLAAQAQDTRTLYKVVDQYGNVSYQETQPPPGVEYETREVPAEPEPEPETPVAERMRIASETNPVTLFLVKKCDACDFVKWFLQNREIPFREVDVEFNVSNQFELKEATGEYRVPAMLVGENLIRGFARAAMTKALVAAGYLDESELEAIDSDENDTRDANRPGANDTVDDDFFDDADGSKNGTPVETDEIPDSDVSGAES